MCIPKCAQTASSTRMQSTQQAKEDAEKRARELKALLDAANKTITELRAANVRTVYGAIVCACDSLLLLYCIGMSDVHE